MLTADRNRRCNIKTKTYQTLSVLLAAFSPLLAVAQLPQPRLDAVTPAGGQPGQTTTVTLHGPLTESATQLVFSHPGITAQQQQQPANQQQAARRRPRIFDVQVAADVPPGRYDVRVLASTGLTGPRAFLVSPLRQSLLNSAQNSRSSPHALRLGEQVHGQVRADQRDYFRFDASAGQRVLVQVWATRLDSRMDAELAIYHLPTPDQPNQLGRRLLRARHDISSDPVASFEAPHAGAYVIELWEKTFRGGVEYHYCLELSERPLVTTVHPAVVQQGKSVEITAFGYHLPGGEVAAGVQDGTHSHWPRGLQALTFPVKPKRTHRLASALPAPSAAVARLNAVGIQLPHPLAGAAPVALGTTELDVTREQEHDLRLQQQMSNQDAAGPEVDNGSADAAQVVTLPADIAGGFWPTHDRDCYRFECQKGATYRVQLQTHQLGLPTDTRLRVQRRIEEKGKVRYQDVASGDDQQGTPNNRDQKQFNSGTRDAALSFKAPATGQYVVTAVDQHNVATADPRLVYRLSIAEQRPDFGLLAYATPRQYKDEKVAQPVGLSVRPGESTRVRVRLHSQAMGTTRVFVRATRLPVGVKSSVLWLSPQEPEGDLLLTATEDATPNVGQIHIGGFAPVGDVLEHRTAATGAIIFGQNNVDQRPTDVRLTASLPLAVLDDAAPAIRLGVPTGILPTSLGAHFSVPLQLARAEGFDGEFTLTGHRLPKGIKLDASKVAAKAKEGTVTLQLTDAKLPTGRHSVVLGGKVTQPRTHNSVAVNEAVADVEHTAALTKAATQAHAKLTEQQRQAAEQFEAAKQQLQKIQQAAEQPTRQHAAKLQQIAALAKRLRAAAEVPSDADAVVLADKRKELDSAWQAWQKVDVPDDGWRQISQLAEQLRQARQVHQSRQQAFATAEKAAQAAGEKLKKLQQTQQAAKQQLQKVRKQQVKPVEYWVYSRALDLDVQASPLKLKLPKSVQLTPGKTVRLPVQLRRQFGFTGQVTLQLDVPTGITATPVVVGPKQSFAHIQLSSTAALPAGRHTPKLTARLQFHGVTLVSQSATQLIIPESTTVAATE